MSRFDSPVAGDEFHIALATTRCAKNIFWYLILVALLGQLTAFVLVDFVGLLNASSPEATSQPATQPATQPAIKAATESDETAEMWAVVLNWTLPTGRFVALVGCLLLVLTLMFAVKLALHGQTGGVAGLIGAFYWSLILLVLLIPWQQVLPGSTLLAGAMHNLSELRIGRTRASGGSVLATLLYYARFLAMPILTLCVLLVVAGRWNKGYRIARGVEVDEVGPVEPAPAEKI